MALGGCLLGCFRLLLVLLGIIMNATALSSPVAVIGGTGRLGRQAVQQLLDQGTECHLLVRKLPANETPEIDSLENCSSSEEVAAYFQQNSAVTLQQGDVGNSTALNELVQDCTACLALWGSTRRSKITDLWNSKSVEEEPSHAKQINYQGVCNLIEACEKSTKCKRIVRITGKGETPKSFFSVLNNLLGSFAKAWNYQGEQALRAASSTIEYTIVRPGIMTTDAETGPFILADNGGDLPVAKINYRDVASLCVESLRYPNAARCTLTAMTTSEDNPEAATSWAPLLSHVQGDRRVFPTDMLEQHFAAVRSALYKIGAATAVLVAVAIKAIFF